MPNLNTLPLELRSEIMKLAMENIPEYYKKDRARDVSLVCRALNDISGPYIFNRYNLDIRQESSLRISPIYPPNSPRYRWDKIAIEQRLAHLRSKAPYVRILTITDYGTCEQNTGDTYQPQPFPLEFIPQLMATLRMLSGLKSIHLATVSRRELSRSMVSLLTDVWDWIRQARPQDLQISGDFKITDDDVTPPIDGLTTLKVKWCSLGHKPLLDTSSVANITLEYFSGPFFLFKPVASKLESITITLNLGGRYSSEPLFDFSGVPRARIKVDGHILSKWQGHSLQNKRLFVEGLSGYYVRQFNTLF
ncbi:hypothetical protein D9615_007317 [Tricholomella constricta]|uniref:Uncharacterized protein n=1 Tax=Tricholomella constricta TaxID=117010 RepID=A0A8H5H550_9AGAR|nr:hypothetical protein D9615_007317 [Tricholomella constricta]